MKMPWPSLESAMSELAQTTFQPRCNYVTLVNHLQNLGEKLIGTSVENRRETIAKFHDCAGKIPYAADCDVGALVLEAIADGIDDLERKRWLYQESLFRANWCAGSGTSGSECHARSKHVERIRQKVQD